MLPNISGQPEVDPLVADLKGSLAMADVLRLVDRFDGLAASPVCKRYVERATARPAFKKAHADQMAHFAAADKDKAAKS